MTTATRHWADIGESTFVFGIWTLYSIYRLFGRWPFRICLYPVVFAHWLTRPLARAASLDYLRRLQAATGALRHPPGRRDSLRHIALFAETILDKLLAIGGRYRFDRVRVQGREPLAEQIARGEGGVIVTAHLGCLELCRVMAGRGNKPKVNILVHTRHAERFNRMLKRLNPDSDLRLMEVTEVTPATAVQLAERVDAGEFVVIAGDRVPVFAGQTVKVEFLGRVAPFPVGPYILAALLKRPLYLVGCIHEGLGYTICFERIAERVELPRGRREAALAEYAGRYVAALTRLLVRSPFDWFNFFPFWDQTNAPTPPKSR